MRKSPPTRRKDRQDQGERHGALEGAGHEQAAHHDIDDAGQERREQPAPAPGRERVDDLGDATDHEEHSEQDDRDDRRGHRGAHGHETEHGETTPMAINHPRCPSSLSSIAKRG